MKSKAEPPTKKTERLLEVFELIFIKPISYKRKRYDTQ